MQFNNIYYYHIYNRGVDRRKIFLDKWDYVRFLESLREFNQKEPVGSLYKIKRGLTPLRGVKPLVQIIAYCLNPNHFHLLLKEEVDRGISEFMKRMGVGYTCYFNERYQRSGALFQGTYKAKEVRSTYDLIKVSIYVNCNAEIHDIAKAQNWPWSGYLDYNGIRRGTLCKQESIFNEISRPEYFKLSEDLIPEIKKIKNLEKYDLE
ncbi:hypothetical protein A2477_03680 [Candidatus Falkowbacteria bacterium RIFOXYC2_FULL_47_12]|uniref:Transposase IS200-like domain-containing protein n=1 Tax=Candidatus Falkowbacteria bacterium RIFOXYC2_FULL_47_12 TaxID=1798004 RepID=A0A1F5TPG1_9BACT|nr:MAG: hypothetical protein A2477_03680 [Candidatus Falkowbacteria bacterium RIFOXYC2_FULL_47_12]